MTMTDVKVLDALERVGQMYTLQAVDCGSQLVRLDDAARSGVVIEGAEQLRESIETDRQKYETLGRYFETLIADFRVETQHRSRPCAHCGRIPGSPQPLEKVSS